MASGSSGPVRKFLQRENVRVFLGVTALLGISAVPLVIKDEKKKGHDLFSQEKPEIIERGEDERARGQVRDRAEKGGGK